MTETLDPLAIALRRFAVDFLTGHHPEVCRDIMTAGYTLTIGGFVLSGRDEEYVPATSAQLALYPGLTVTVHDVLLGPDRAAFRFTEHGGSGRHAGAVAAWAGIAVFRAEHGRLAVGFAEEDYLGRRLQLAAGRCDPIEPPHPAPWEISALPAQAGVAAAVRSWLDDGCPAGPLGSGFRELGGHPGEPLLDVTSLEVNELFAAGERGAFHATYRGPARAAPGSQRQPSALHVAGIADVEDGRVVAATIVRDRQGLDRQLRAALSASADS